MPLQSNWLCIEKSSLLSVTLLLLYSPKRIFGACLNVVRSSQKREPKVL